MNILCAIDHLHSLVNMVVVNRCIINSITFPQRPLNTAAFTSTL
jgi:hypothetical protein